MLIRFLSPERDEGETDGAPDADGVSADGGCTSDLRLTTIIFETAGQNAFVDGAPRTQTGRPGKRCAVPRGIDQHISGLTGTRITRACLLPAKNASTYVSVAHPPSPAWLARPGRGN